MKVSVIIPAHNEEKYIAATLKAVLEQTHENYEVIVVDNASTDKTSDIVTAHFPNVKLIYEDRKGLLFAREAGRKAATGDIIVNTDADCIPHKDWLTKGVDYFTSEKIVAVTGPCYYHDAGPVFRNVTFTIQKTVYPFISRLFQTFRLGAVLIGGNTFIRAKVLHEVGGYNTSIAFYGEDTDTAKRLLTKGTILFKNDLITKTSSRRFVEHGTWETVFRYFLNFIWVTFAKNPYRKIKFHAQEIFSERTK